MKNADLSAIFTQAQKNGVSTLKITLRNCLDELLEDDWIEQTRQVYFSAANKSRPNLYAITLWAVDDCFLGEGWQTNSPDEEGFCQNNQIVTFHNSW
ncbi:hypothetical protein LF296_03720 [Acinetobacter vivianii]|uniref:Uncharacterized protein n=1 Tax=Acinetobacter vivianii TaxID=1776742 RepID=A0AAJ6P5T3_9GAMM|nr:hypothetical protein [Acinetobacter vivianii]WDZ51908.1 hypothetical protein LF296_03720 [Acinetobacter vivianii]